MTGASEMDVAAELGTATHCPYCALQCGMMLQRSTDGWTTAARDFPTNKGGMCRKGWTSAEVLAATDRLTTPLLRDRRGGVLRPVSWDEALDRVAAGMRAIRSTHGADAMAVFGGGALTNEKAYLLGKFARVVLGTANIDYNGRFCMASAAAAGLRAFGIDRGLPFPLEDIPGAQCVLIAGGNPAETMPPIMQYFEEQRGRGGRLIVVDPRRSETAKAAHLHLQLTPGTDAALANGLLHIAIQNRLIDQDFIDSRTTGFAPVRRVVASYWPDRVERITGVPAVKLHQAAHMLGESASAMLLSGRGPEQQSNGTDNVLAFINLMLALGHAGKPHSGYGCLTGQGNGQGGREHGQKADQLPGYRKLNNATHRAEIAALWGIDPDSLPQPGLSACEILDGVGGPVRGLMVMASNILVSAPDSTRLAARLDGLDLLVVADIFLSETAARADVVLPVAQWAEEAGTMTNLEGRVILRRQAKDAPEGVRTDLQILAGLAERLGSRSAIPSDPRAVFGEFRRATAGGTADYSGISWERIAQEDGVFWPCPGPGHTGTPRLFLDRFGTEDGRARFTPVEFRGAAELPDATYPLVLTTGRVLSQYQTGTQTRRVPSLQQVESEAFAEIHPQTARGLRIADGDTVRLVTRRGEAAMRARFSPAIRFDTVFAPFHWAGANALTNAALDPVSRIPEFKVCAVRIERIAAHEKEARSP